MDGPSQDSSPDDAPLDRSQLPTLYHDVSFWGMAVTQFLGAFNDNLFKQLLLLLATPTAAELKAALAAGGAASDLQSEAQITFALAFLMFSGSAGYVADRISKRTIIVGSKTAEIGVMLAGMAGFYYYGTIGLPGMLVVLFFMGTQSAFFSPAKYGILPEMLRDSDLPRTNGIFLMLTFVSIILGTALAGPLLDAGVPVWLASTACVAIAVLGTATSLLVRRVPPVEPDLRYTVRAATVDREIVALVRGDHQLCWAIVVASMFWMLGGIVQQTVNALGKSQLAVSDTATSILAGMVAVGIAIGCPLGGVLSRGHVSPRIVAVGAWGIVAMLALLSLPGSAQGQLLGYWGSLPALAVLGIFTGLFIVPVQVMIQLRPPRTEKGRVIALMNQCTWIGIILGALIYEASIRVLDALGGPRSAIFAVTALIMLPVAALYRPAEMDLGGSEEVRR